MKKLITTIEPTEIIRNKNLSKDQYGVSLESKASSLTQGNSGIGCEWHARKDS